jgi:hypothetical protein
MLLMVSSKSLHVRGPKGGGGGSREEASREKEYSMVLYEATNRPSADCSRCQQVTVAIPIVD